MDRTVSDAVDCRGYIEGDSFELLWRLLMIFFHEHRQLLHEE